jgi:hypothetical protein
METYLFKFSACLAIFWLVYVLFLERQDMHRFKRFYLLGAFVTALIIPILTITYYVKPVLDLGNFDPYGYATPPFIPIEIEGQDLIITESLNHLPIILWSIYGIGVAFFAIRFIVNLFKMYKRISNNEKVVERSFLYVLLKELSIPHSFFNYIFINKSKYEADDIPKEVLLHEETHAKQLHSLDIVIIELLQIAFWFHPLVYILKHHIKLNHEFLADQAVLKLGTDTKTYQNILLQFSSKTQEYQLSSAINYSSIKKRFTVMKTQTSKTRIWISSFLLLPIVALLFYGFAEREYVEKVTIPPTHLTNDDYARSIELKILNENSYLIDGIKATKKTFVNTFNQLHQDITSEVRNKVMNIHVTSSKEISNKETWFIYYSLQDYGFYRIVTPSQEINKAKGNTPFAIENHLSKHEKVTAKQVAEYNTWSKKLNNQDIGHRIIKKLDHDKFKAIYQKMTAVQKKNAEPFPQIPLPPAPSINTKRTPNYSQNKNQQVLKTIKIDIDKDYNILLNSKSVEFKNLAIEADKINPNISEENKRNFVMSSILLPDNNFVEFGKKIMIELRKVNIFQNTTVYVANQIKSGTKPKHFDLYAGLTVEEAKVKRINILKNYQDNNVDEQIERINNDSKNKWKIKTNVEYIKDSPAETQQKATKKQIAEYNAWAKKLNSQALGDIIIKKKDLAKYKKIYSLMTVEQKKNAQPFPQLPPPPPPPPAPAPEVKKGDNSNIPPPPPPTKVRTNKNDKRLTLAEIIKQTPKSVESGYELLENGESHYFTVHKGEKTYYNKDGYITNNKGKILPPPPPPPKNPSFLEYIIDMEKEGASFHFNGEEITAEQAKKVAKSNKGKNTDMLTQKDENGKYIVKLSNNFDNVPPPPPAPETTLDFVIRMAKSNAKFFNEGKPISSDKAIDLIKKNPKLNINAQKTDSKKPLVYITKKPILIGEKGKSKN